MVVGDIELKRMLAQLIEDPDYSLVNPASIDIRVGLHLLQETLEGGWHEVGMGYASQHSPYVLDPGALVMVATMENITIPNGYAAELKLKSSAARRGYNHALAFWVDPGWSGILTMELKNWTRFSRLPLYPGMKIAQLVIHKMDQPAEFPYVGRYKGATKVEGYKPEIL